MNAHTSAPSSPLGAPTRMLELGDCALPYWRIGSGPDVVLVHGWPLDSRTWRHLVPQLSQHYTCHLIDLPGAGQSRWTRDTRIGLRENATTLLRAIDAMGLSSYALIGHDSGATFARFVAAEDPARVRALVLGNTEIPGHHPWQIKVFQAAGRIPGGTALLVAGLRFRLGRRSPLGLGGCFVDPDVAEGEFLQLFLEPLFRDRRKVAGQMRLGENLDFAVMDELATAHAAITAPTRYIWGAEDPWFPLAKAREMVGQMGGPADLVTISPGKLFVHEEFPDAFHALAEPFLAAAFNDVENKGVKQRGQVTTC